MGFEGDNICNTSEQEKKKERKKRQKEKWLLLVELYTQTSAYMQLLRNNKTSSTYRHLGTFLSTKDNNMWKVFLAYI